MSFKIVEEYEMEGLKCKINTGSGYGGFNGYITYPKRPLKETGYNGIASYIPVHGGLTYANTNEDGTFTYGFDTSHCYSNEFPNTDIDWIKSQIKVIYDGISICKKLENKYLLAEGDNDKRAKIVQKIYDAGKQNNKGYPFNVSIKLLSGNL